MNFSIEYVSKFSLKTFKVDFQLKKNITNITLEQKPQSFYIHKHAADSNESKTPTTPSPRTDKQTQNTPTNKRHNWVSDPLSLSGVRANKRPLTRAANDARCRYGPTWKVRSENSHAKCTQCESAPSVRELSKQSRGTCTGNCVRVRFREIFECLSALLWYPRQEALTCDVVRVSDAEVFYCSLWGVVIYPFYIECILIYKYVTLLC